MRRVCFFYYRFSLSPRMSAAHFFILLSISVDCILADLWIVYADRPVGVGFLYHFESIAPSLGAGLYCLMFCRTCVHCTVAGDQHQQQNQDSRKKYLTGFREQSLPGMNPFHFPTLSFVYGQSRISANLLFSGQREFSCIGCEISDRGNCTACPAPIPAKQ